MKTTEEIFAQFEDIPSLPVSEETIGSYLEGNLTDNEIIAMHDLMADDDDFADFVSAIDTDDPYAIDLGEFADDDNTYIDLSDYPTHTDYTESSDMPSTSDTYISDHISAQQDFPDFSDQTDFSDLPDTSDPSDSFLSSCL